jgi:hypothetical protein
MVNCCFVVQRPAQEPIWPADHEGCGLQMQTIGLAKGIGGHYAGEAGSSTNNRMSFPIEPAKGSVSYCLAYP